jgi:hypothetical protein
VWLITGSPTAATVLAATVLGVKAFSAVRMARLPMPRMLSGCAVLDVRGAAASRVTAST